MDTLIADHVQQPQRVSGRAEKIVALQVVDLRCFGWVDADLKLLNWKNIK